MDFLNTLNSQQHYWYIPMHACMHTTGTFPCMHVHHWYIPMHACTPLVHSHACMYTTGTFPCMHVHHWYIPMHACTPLVHSHACMYTTGTFPCMHVQVYLGVIFLSDSPMEICLDVPNMEYTTTGTSDVYRPYTGSSVVSKP